MRLEHLKALIEAQQGDEGSVADLEAEAAEIEAMVESLSAEPEIVTSEGLVFDFPQSTGSSRTACADRSKASSAPGI